MRQSCQVTVVEVGSDAQGLPHEDGDGGAEPDGSAVDGVSIGAGTTQVAATEASAGTYRRSAAGPVSPSSRTTAQAAPWSEIGAMALGSLRRAKERREAEEAKGISRECPGRAVTYRCICGGNRYSAPALCSLSQLLGGPLGLFSLAPVPHKHSTLLRAEFSIACIVVRRSGWCRSCVVHRDGTQSGRRTTRRT